MIELPGKVVGYQDHKLLITAPLADDWEVIKKEIKDCEVRLRDGREISAEQRKKIYATLRDIADYTGHETEELKDHFKADYVARTGEGWFSLSDTDMTTANRFLTLLLEFCLAWDIPVFGESLKDRSPDIGRYVYACLVHHKCCLCGKKAELHHVEAVGMGRNRREIPHLGVLALPLCREHHTEAHALGRHTFEEKHHLVSVALDGDLCQSWSLKGEEK